MDSKDLEYPTEQQMDECWTAWKESGKEGLRKCLRKQLSGEGSDSEGSGELGDAAAGGCDPAG